MARDAQNIANAYGRQTAPDGQLNPAYGLANAQVIGPVRSAAAGTGGDADPAGARPRDAGARLERRQPVPGVAIGWHAVTLTRADRLSFYFCSGYDFRTAHGRAVDDDIAGVGCR